MKFRDYKNFTRQNYYHVFNRGNNKDLIFSKEEDYLLFLNKLKIILGIKKGESKIKPLPKGCIEVICYCLMDNHFHLLLKQHGDTPISQLMGKLCTSYARSYNRKNNRIGSLFQDTFKAKLIETEEHLIYLSAYIHNNPTGNPLSYPFSSINEYLQGKKDICNTDHIMELFEYKTDRYEEFIKQFIKIPKLTDNGIFEI